MWQPNSTQYLQQRPPIAYQQVVTAGPRGPILPTPHPVPGNVGLPIIYAHCDAAGLEYHFNQLSFAQPPPYYHPPPQPKFQPRPSNNNNKIPQLMDIRVPRPAHLFQRHPKHLVDTSVPPPRITLLQKPRPEPPAEPKKIEPEIVSQKVKILKRPASTPSNLSSQGQTEAEKAAFGQKSLKQREEEYAQARLRILGSAGSDDEDKCGSVQITQPAQANAQDEPDETCEGDSEEGGVKP